METDKQQFVVVHLNDQVVVGPFASEDEAEEWTRNVPNRLFETEEEYDHADTNSDFFVTTLEAAVGGLL